MLVPDHRTLIVLASLVGAMTLASGLLLLLEPGPATSVQEMSLSSVERSPRRRGGDLFLTRAKAKPGRWSAIVIHCGSDVSAATPSGRRGDAQKAGGDQAYHFVVRAGDRAWTGQLEMGDRWNDQRSGAYWAGVESDWVNHHAVGIRLRQGTGRQGPTEGQLSQLVWLVQRLQTKFQIPAERVILHVDPGLVSRGGRWFPEAWFRQQLLTFASS